MNCVRRVLVLLIASAAPAHAADHWLLTDSSSTVENSPVWIGLVRGDTFPISSEPANQDDVFAFTDRGPAQTALLDGRSTRDGAFSAHQPLRGIGFHALAAVLQPRTTADGALIQSAKTIVEVEPTAPEDGSYAEPLGHILEIIPLSNPCRWKTGQRVAVRVLLDGHAWGGVGLSTAHESGPDQDTERAMSASDGTASFNFDRAGYWCMSARMERLRDGVAKSQKETLTATFTFRVRGASDVSRMLVAVRSIHGDLDPAAVLGYRMGQTALNEMGLLTESTALEAVVWSPSNSVLLGMLDGVQAATKASFGRGTLRLESAPSSVDAQAIFTDRATSRRVICALKPDAELMGNLLTNADAGARQEAAMWVATRDDAELFTVTVLPSLLDDPNRKAPSRLTEAVIANADSR